MKIGISMPHSGFLTERGNITSIASKADILGFDFLTVSDHIVIPKYVDSKMPYAVDSVVVTLSKILVSLFPRFINLTTSCAVTEVEVSTLLSSKVVKIAPIASALIIIIANITFLVSLMPLL